MWCCCWIMTCTLVHIGRLAPFAASRPRRHQRAPIVRPRAPLQLRRQLPAPVIPRRQLARDKKSRQAGQRQLQSISLTDTSPAGRVVRAREPPARNYLKNYLQHPRRAQINEPCRSCRSHQLASGDFCSRPGLTLDNGAPMRGRRASAGRAPPPLSSRTQRKHPTWPLCVRLCVCPATQLGRQRAPPS